MMNLNFSREDKLRFLEKLGYVNYNISLVRGENQFTYMNISIPSNSEIGENDLLYKILDYEKDKTGRILVPSKDISIDRFLTNLVFEREFNRCFLNMVASYNKIDGERF